jgi:hypothetical protein
MTEPLSTQGMPLRWVGDARTARDRDNTRFFLFAHEAGHLVVHETIQGEQEGGDAADSTGVESAGNTASSARQTIRVPRAQKVKPHPTDRYILLKKYEGFVTSRSQDSFWARLFENSSDYPVLEAEFDIEELSETDRELAVEGASMVWTIGYRYEGSTRKRESSIYLRRLPRWTDAEIAEAKEAAGKLTCGISWE